MSVLPQRPADLPILARWINRILLVLLILAAIAAGYYANLAQSQARTIRRLREQINQLSTQVVVKQE